jgi:hypothetical protein
MPERPKLGELLVMAGAIDQTQLGTALAEQRRFGRPLGATLVRMGFLDEEALIRTLARQLKLPIAWLRGKWVEQEVLDLVPAELALKHRCLPLTVNDAGRGKVLHLAMQDPGDLETLDAIRFHVGHNVRPVLAAPSELEEALQRHYESGKSEGRAAARHGVFLVCPVSNAGQALRAEQVRQWPRGQSLMSLMRMPRWRKTNSPPSAVMTQDRANWVFEDFEALLVR